MTEVFEYCLIGSGAASYAFLRGLVQQRGNKHDLRDIAMVTSDVGSRLSRVLFDAPKSCVSSEQRSLSIRTDSKKLYFGDDYVYRPHPFWDAPRSGYGHDPSFSFGGLTRVWGATADLWPEPELQRLSGSLPFCENDKEMLREILFSTVVERESETKAGPESLRISRSLDALVSKTSGKRERWRFKPARLAVNKSSHLEARSCISCGTCLDGCPVDAIWSADRAWEPYLPKLGRVAVGLVTEIVATQEYVRVTYVDNNIKSEIYAKKCILAAGVPSTVRLFSQVANLSATSGDDTPIQFRLGISLQKGEALSHNLSHVFAESSLGHAQFYPPNTQVWEPFLSPRILQSKVMRALMSRLIPIITYSSSVKDCITYAGGTFSASRPKGARTLHFSLGCSLIRRGIFLFPLISKRGKYGESYHSGAFFKSSIRCHGFASVDERVFVADAAGLPFLVPGSITPTVMLNSIRLARYLASEGEQES